MLITLMCPKCGSVKGREDDESNYTSDTCHYCNIERIIIDFDESLLEVKNDEEFDILEKKINRKFLYQLPTFDEDAYEARIKSETGIDIKKEREEIPESEVNNHEVSILGGCALQLLGVILFFLFLSIDEIPLLINLFIGFTGVIVGGIVIGIAKSKRSSEQDNNDRWKEIENGHKSRITLAKLSPQYDTICINSHKPINPIKIRVENNELSLKFPFVETDLDCWADSTNFYLISSWNSVVSLANMYVNSKVLDPEKIDSFLYKKIIPLNNIHSYKQDGEIYNETKITGGGGGGSSIVGAIVGGGSRW